ncbi:endonuclease domain-containing protein [Dialister succinatiphilus]|uniref:endonuclease domain-containing protein n=1 Tax=Dialister succinatiphilus TaxID=487173 RepID=UPI002357623F|nr:endonuclease domain-containing protein [Dialister succinatiphilus]
MKPKPLDFTLKKRARSMRQNMTPQESRMWLFCLKRLPFHFRRQDVKSPFIADFTCRKAKLIIEIDGTQHNSDCGKSYDEWRSGKLNEKGYMVLRFTNEDIEKRFTVVCDMVLHTTETRIKELESKR